MTMLAGLALVAGLPFAAYSTLVLHHFYNKGAFFFDSGLLAFLISQGDPHLSTPPFFGGDSFFATHVAPIFILTALIDRLLAVLRTLFFAAFIGFCHALPAIGVFSQLVCGYRMRSPAAVIAAALLGVAFSFNGLALAIARYPHFEMLIVGAAVIFFAALSQKRAVIAAVSFAACLAVREDAGLHLFAVLCILLIVNRWHGIAWRTQKSELTFAFLALSYSVCANWAQSAVFPGHSSLTRIYLGDPAFAELTFATITDRLLGYLVYRAYIVLPAAIAVAWAVIARNPYIVVGYIAFVPWAMLHLGANSNIAGTLSGYYAYPFMIASFWPLVGVLLKRRLRAETHALAAEPVLGFSLMIAVSFTALSSQYNPGHLAYPESFLSPPSLGRQEATDRGIAALVRATPYLGRVLVDGSVLALAPNDFGPGETVERGSSGHPDTVIYFADGYDAAAARTLAASAGLDRQYLVRGTLIRLATDRRLERWPPLAVLLHPIAGWSTSCRGPRRISPAP